MACNLDEFANDLTHATQQVVQAATTNSQTRAILDAAKTGDTATVARLAAAMSTADLERVKRQLES
jgi:hypothetical protein